MFSLLGLCVKWALGGLQVGSMSQMAKKNLFESYLVGEHKVPINILQYVECR